MLLLACLSLEKHLERSISFDASFDNAYIIITITLIASRAEYRFRPLHACPV